MRKSSVLSVFVIAAAVCSLAMTSCTNIAHNDYSNTLDHVPVSVLKDIDTAGITDSTTVIEEDLAVTPDIDEANTVSVTEAEPATPASVTLCLLGDIMCLSGQQYSARLSDGSHDYRGNYTLIKPIFDECDYVAGNLETCLAPSSPYSAEAKKIDGRPNCNASADLLDSLTSVGITHLVTANNHCLDAGTAGIAETLAALDEAGIAHTGTHTPETVQDNCSDYMLIKSDDITVAIISVTELINRRDLVAPADMSKYVNEYSPDFFTEKIKAAREEGATYVIAYEHWGNENTHELLEIQKEHARVIAEAGADLIIGSHSHCVQPMENIVTSDSRVVRCYYSLGNVVSSMEKDINHDTVLVKLHLTWDENGDNRTLVSTIDSIPCHMIWNLDGVQFVVAPTDCDTGHDSNNNELKEAEERIWSVLEWKYE